MKNKIIGIKIDKNVQDVIKIQEILSDYGNVIKTRLGINHLENDDTGLRGIIILELFGDKSEIKKMKKELKKINNIKIGKLVF